MLLEAIDTARQELEQEGIRFFDTWYLDDGQIFCKAEHVERILRSLDKGFATIGATRGEGENLKSAVRFFGDESVSLLITPYILNSAKG